MVFHLIHIRHRDEVEAPITDWLREACEPDGLASKPVKVRPRSKYNPKSKRISISMRAHPVAVAWRNQDE
jgi:hypothetical protein